MRNALVPLQVCHPNANPSRPVPDGSESSGSERSDRMSGPVHVHGGSMGERSAAERAVERSAMAQLPPAMQPRPKRKLSCSSTTSHAGAHPLRRRKSGISARERNLRRLESNERERMRMHSLNDAFEVSTASTATTATDNNRPHSNREHCLGK